MARPLKEKTTLFVLSVLLLIAACESSLKGKLSDAFPGYQIPKPPGGVLKDGPYSLEGDLDLDGKKDLISFLVATDKSWVLTIIFSKTKKVETIYKDSSFSFSEEMDLSLFSPRDFEKWKQNRKEGDPLLADAQHVNFTPFAIVVAYGETSAQAFYWKDNHFHNFWIGD